MALKKKVSFEVFLDNNDWKEINSALPQLAKRRLVKQVELIEELGDLLDQNFLKLLESFNLSFAKEIDDNWSAADGECLEDIPGFSNAIMAIDEKVFSFMQKENVIFKTTDFDSESALENWLSNYDVDTVYGVLANALWENRRSCIADRIVQAIARL